jgi:hypothetical protein
MRIPNYVDLYELAHDHLLSSPAFEESGSAPWQAVEYHKMNHAYQCLYRGEH